MKGSYITLLVVATFKLCFVFGQNCKTELLDELSRSSEIAKPSVFNRLAKCYSNDSVQEAIRYSKKAIQQVDKLLQVKELNFTEEVVNSILSEKAIALSHIADVLYAAEKYSKAEEYYTKALDVYKTLNDPENLLRSLNDLGLVCDIQQNYHQAKMYFEEALKLSRKIGSETYVATVLNNLGSVYLALGENDQALTTFRRAFSLQQNLALYEDMAISLNNIGRVYEQKSDYDNALSCYFKALNIIDSLKINNSDLSSYYNNIGNIYKIRSQYDKAIQYFSKALELDKKSFSEEKIARRCNNIGEVYRAWGNNEKALQYFETALSLYRKKAATRDISTLLNNIASLYQSEGKLDKAITYYKEAIKYSQDNNLSEQSLNLKNIGALYKKAGNYEKALECYRLSLEMDKKTGNQHNIAVSYNNIGQIYYLQDKYPQALEYYQKALAIDLKQNLKEDIATDYNNLAYLYDAMDSVAKAIEYLNESVRLFEEIRKTAPEALRKDYLSKTISAYQKLLTLYIRTNNNEAAFHTLELCKARSLSEQIADSDTLLRIPQLSEVQNKIRQKAEKEAYLLFSNTNTSDIVICFLNGDTVIFRSVPVRLLTRSLSEKFHEELRMLLNTQIIHEYAIDNVDSLQSFIDDETDRRMTKLRTAIDFYRQLIFDPYGEKLLPDAGLLFYHLLIYPFHEVLSNTENLIISPDGILGFLPFETLCDENKKYLAENYSIAYTPSVAVKTLLEGRNYKENRKAALALGGAVYDEATYYSEMDFFASRGRLVNKDFTDLTSLGETEMRQIRQNLITATEQNVSFAPLYNQLGYSWSNLKYTLIEVRQIARLIPGCDTITAYNATEKNIKQMSKNGELSQYKILHFSTHGMAVPEFPELSAIVLSQFKNPALQFGEDGYLRMSEICKLDINADFVNLSSCETALGKIYNGEGVVGLTQAFLIAGANGISASLWQVADESTAEFMVELYRLSLSSKHSYSRLITEVKRKFINGEFGEEWKSPYFWAPFVYYGK